MININTPDMFAYTQWRQKAASALEQLEVAYLTKDEARITAARAVVDRLGKLEAAK